MVLGALAVLRPSCLACRGAAFMGLGAAVKAPEKPPGQQMETPKCWKNSNLLQEDSSLKKPHWFESPKPGLLPLVPVWAILWLREDLRSYFLLFTPVWTLSARLPPFCFRRGSGGREERLMAADKGSAIADTPSACASNCSSTAPWRSAGRGGQLSPCWRRVVPPLFPVPARCRHLFWEGLWAPLAKRHPPTGGPGSFTPFAFATCLAMSQILFILDLLSFLVRLSLITNLEWERPDWCMHIAFGSSVRNCFLLNTASLGKLLVSRYQTIN